MDSTYYTSPEELSPLPPRKSYFKPYGIPLLLFLITVITTTIAGTLWAGQNYWEITNWKYGITYSLLLMAFLSAHEFGHYFASRYHKVDASLPYFLPMPFVMLSPFGTFGAFIKTREPISNRKALFDIGVAGPLAGFAVCLVILFIGMTNLPPKEYLYSIHPEYMMNGGEVLPYGLYFGSTLLYDFFAWIFVRPGEFLPPMNVIGSYPFLCVGWFGMFVTALNMLPIGQLDGGHIIYAMFGKHQRIISRVFWWILLVIGMGSLVELALVSLEKQVYYFAPKSEILDVFAWLKTHGKWYFELWNGWLFWVIVTRFIMKLNHPPTQYSEPIGRNRMIVGYISIVIFILSFSMKGIYIIPEHEGHNSNGLMKFVKRNIPWDDD